MKFLGIRNGHDQNVTYTDGTKVKYLKFERLYQKKHWNYYDESGMDYDDSNDIIAKAQSHLGFKIEDLDAVAVSWDPTAHRLDRTMTPNELYREPDKNILDFEDQFKCPYFDIDHHYAHTLSTWPLAHYDAINTHFVLDGLGNHVRWASAFKNDKLVDFIDRFESMGLSVTLEYLAKEVGIGGMSVDLSGKIMALQAWHRVPEELEKSLSEWFAVHKLRNLDSYLDFAERCLKMCVPPLTEKESKLALSHLVHVFGMEKLPQWFLKYLDGGHKEVFTYSGGTAQNTLINGSLKKQFPNMIIPPHCPDDGISLGCVEFLRRKYDQEPFDRTGFPFWQTDEAPESRPSDATVDKTAELLAKGKIVGWYQGNGEIGPRALGNRSILMDPSIKDGKAIINERVKHRESYRPFGASVLLEDTPKVFDCDFESEYMLYVVKCLDESLYPSIVHKDGSCRIQTVKQEPAFEDYYRLIDRFKSKTGIPLLLNTSLNVDGKPIAGYTNDAREVLKNSDMDALVIGDELIVK